MPNVAEPTPSTTPAMLRHEKSLHHHDGLEGKEISQDVLDDRSQRIPRALQHVFVASNTGKQVDTPPEQMLASTVFVRSWVNKGSNREGGAGTKTLKSGSSSALPTLFEESREKINCFAQNIPDGVNTERAAERSTSSSTRSMRRASFRERSKCPPQMLLDEAMVSRGYCADSYQTLHTSYYKSPTELQLASYGPYMIRMVKESNADGLRAALKAGISPNPCNQFGESLVHMACRRGDMKILSILLDAGASVQVADDYGRTPLHDACWAANPAFDVVEAILKLDTRLFYMKDCRGSLPLFYVHRDHFDAWSTFLLDRAVPIYYPLEQATGDTPPPLCKLHPNALPLPNPKDCMSTELAKMVANGKMTPSEALIMKQDGSTASYDESDSDCDSECSAEDDDEDDDDESDCDSEESSSSSSICNEDEEEDLFTDADKEIFLLAQAGRGHSNDSTYCKDIDDEVTEMEEKILHLAHYCQNKEMDNQSRKVRGVFNMHTRCWDTEVVEI
ncbi:hypothetical protein ACA910_001296 [Epithemia clementina (nom. ined.)]